MDYDICKSPMEKVYVLYRLDEYQWCCGHVKCKKTKSATGVTWFKKSKLALKQALTFI
jgi:hypothetical protein